MGSTGSRTPGGGATGQPAPPPSGAPHDREWHRQHLADRVERVGDRVDRLTERKERIANRLSNIDGSLPNDVALRERLENRQEHVGRHLESSTARETELSGRLSNGQYGPKKQRPRMAGDAVAAQNSSPDRSNLGPSSSNGQNNDQDNALTRGFNTGR